MLDCMTQLTAVPSLTDFDRTTNLVPVHGPPGEFSVALDPGWSSLDPRSLLFSGGARAMVRGYLRPLERRPVDSSWLAMATDWFPPPAFVRLEPPTGGVSIDLTTHIHQPRVVLAPDAWLTAAFEIESSAGGLAVEHGLIAQRDATLVAESFQTRLTARD